MILFISNRNQIKFFLLNSANMSNMTMFDIFVFPIFRLTDKNLYSKLIIYDIYLKINHY